MKSRIFTHLPLAVALACLAMPVLLQALEAAPAAPTRLKPILVKRMKAEDILSNYGKPNEVIPMKAKDMTAEKWIYRFRARETTYQDASSIVMVPSYTGFSGNGGVRVVDTPRVEQRLKHITIYHVTALLMIDGALVSGKQWYEKEEKFAN